MRRRSWAMNISSSFMGITRIPSNMSNMPVAAREIMNERNMRSAKRNPASGSFWSLAPRTCPSPVEVEAPATIGVGESVAENPELGEGDNAGPPLPLVTVTSACARSGDVWDVLEAFPFTG